LRDASPVKENKSGGASDLSFSCRRLPGISTEYRIQVLSLRANDLCFRAGSAIDYGARHETKVAEPPRLDLILRRLRGPARLMLRKISAIRRVPGKYEYVAVSLPGLGGPNRSMTSGGN
jgi:hypothetical protein